ncbi:MAG: 5'-nucleotidase, lipoprotein e(P4) family [Bacilli bacterium]
MNKKINLVLSFVVTLLLVGCGNTKDATSNKGLDKNLYTSNILALNWEQQSGEFNARGYQAYNIATDNLVQRIKEPTTKPLAVVLDIDETVLDNSPSVGEDTLSNRAYSKENFTKWANRAECKLISGADKFLNKAKAFDVEVFYVTNRYKEDVDATIQNMQKLNLPYADYEHIIYKDQESSKGARWDAISNKYEIVMFCGDNLNDFNIVFEKKNNEERKQLVKEMKDEFGKKYIILPNAIYGDWEGALYGYDYSKTEKQKFKDRYDLINK